MVKDNELYDTIKSSAFHVGLDQSEKANKGFIARVFNFIKRIFVRL